MEKDEIVMNLTLAAEYLPESLRSHRDVLIVGGAAMVLDGCTSKITYDIDVIYGVEDAAEHFEMFSIGDAAKEVCHLPKGYEERMVKVGEFENGVTYWRLSKLDIIHTKLQRNDNKDKQDLQRSGWLDLIDWSTLLDICRDEAETNPFLEEM